MVERELRTTIFDKFRTTITPALLSANDDDAMLLQRYVQGYGGLSLGQMLTIIERSKRSRSPLLKAFCEWLRREHPWLGAGLQRLRTDRMIALRNREDHADMQSIAPADLATMAQTCRDLLNLVVMPRAR